jgi:hypothetical protein
MIPPNPRQYCPLCIIWYIELALLTEFREGKANGALESFMYGHM